MYVSFMTLCTSVQLKNMYTSGHLPHCAATPSSANHSTETRKVEPVCGRATDPCAVAPALVDDDLAAVSVLAYH